MKKEIKIKDVLQSIKELKQDREIKELKQEVKDLKEKNRPKTFFEKEWEQTKKEAFED
jgi:hypothetical protein